jgi:hypothetical protein
VTNVEHVPDGTNRVAISVCVILSTLMQALDTTLGRHEPTAVR